MVINIRKEKVANDFIIMALFLNGEARDAKAIGEILSRTWEWACTYGPLLCMQNVPLGARGTFRM